MILNETCILFADRQVDSLYSLFKYERNCSHGVTILPKPECVVHPTMMCNGVQNCPNCSDEIYENCMQAHCSDGKTSFLFSLSFLSLRFLNVVYYIVLFSMLPQAIRTRSSAWIRVLICLLGSNH